MRGAYLDDTTALNDISLADEHRGGALLADVRWRDANLAVFSWSRPHPLLRRFGIQYTQAIKLGDELVACTSQGRKGKMKDRHVCLRDASAAVRANRQVATALRAQGLNEDADRFAYRAQVCQRKVLRLQRHYVRYLGSLFLWLIAGYGYRPLWSFLTYVAVVAGFAVAYVLLGPGAGIHFLPLDAAVFSITSFHGRGFMPGEPFTLHSVIAVLAAAEAIVGLLIEIIFIATFTQRFFAR